MSLLASFLLASAVTSGCDGQSPTTPTPVVQGTPVPTQLQPLHLVGFVVDGANNPVADATLTFWSSPRLVVRSSANGAYDATVLVRPPGRSTYVTVDKPGYEESDLPMEGDPAAISSHDLRLHQIERLAAGESVRMVVSPGDSTCGYHYGLVCRRVRVVSGSSGTLNMEVTSNGGDRFGVVLGEGPWGFPAELEPRIVVPVTAGSEVIVNVGTGSLAGPQGVTLVTTVTPAG
jgi:hypothetical protein